MPMVTITRVSSSDPSMGRMITRSMIIPPAKEITRTTAMVVQKPRPPTMWNCHARNVANIAISPCAKLRMWVDRYTSTSASARLA